MNYIKMLEADKAAMAEKLGLLNAELTELMAYLSSTKFQGVDNDYVHVSTDILPKIREIRALTL